MISRKLKEEKTKQNRQPSPVLFPGRSDSLISTLIATRFFLLLGVLEPFSLYILQVMASPELLSKVLTCLIFIKSVS